MICKQLFVSPIVSLAFATFAFAQQPAQGSWAGWARCQINVQGPGYADQQTHTWTITGSTAKVEGAFLVYPGTWSVVGSGSLQRSQGNQTLMAQWATNAPNVSAPIAVFVRASDNRMFIQARHAQLRGVAGIQGYQQLVIDGKPQTPGKIASEAFEWSFPEVVVTRPNPNASLVANGSSTPVVNGSVGLMQPAGSQATASCTWQFSQGAAPAPPPTLTAQAIPTPPAPPGGSAPTSTPAPGAPASGTPVAVAPTRPVTTTSPPATPAASGGPVAVAPTSPASTTAPPSAPPAPAMTVTTVIPAVLATPTMTCTLRGPAISYYRQPYLSPGRVNVIFDGVLGATGYTVSRNDLGLLTPTPLPQAGMWEHKPAFTAPLNYSAKYVYTFTAVYPNGCGSTTLTISPPMPGPPRVVVDTKAGGGRVSFQATVRDYEGSDYAGVLVTGPALPPAGRIVMKTDPTSWNVDFTIDGVPAGMRTWVITPFWDIPGGRVMEVSTGANVTVNVP